MPFFFLWEFINSFEKRDTDPIAIDIFSFSVVEHFKSIHPCRLPEFILVDYNCPISLK